MRFNEHLKYTIAASALIAGMATAPASAVIEEITISAERRVGTLQDTPIAVTAFTADDIIQSSINTAQDLQNYTPNMVITNNSNISSPEVYIRGVGTSSASSGSDISVGFYLDEVYLGRSDAIFEFFDVERVEILKGPQGTLWGRNTIGGAVNVITKMPTDEAEVSASVNYGNFDYQAYNARMAGPLSDASRASLSLGFKDGGGYIENIGTSGQTDFMDKGEVSVRTVFDFDLSSAIGFTLRADASRTDVSPISYQAVQGTSDSATLATVSACSLTVPGYPGGSLPSAATCDAIGFGSPVSPTPPDPILAFPVIPADGVPASLFDPTVPNLLTLLGGALGPFDVADTYGLLGSGYTTPTNPYAVDHDQPGSQKRTQFGVSGTFDFDLNDATLTSISAYRQRDTRLGEDTDGTNRPWVYNNSGGNYWQVSQELRFSNNNPDRLTWQFGAYYFHSEDTGFQNLQSPGIDDIMTHPSIGLPPIFLLGGSYETNEISDVDTTSIAFYGQADYDVNDRFTISGGLRFTQDEKTHTYEKICGDAVLASPMLLGTSLLCADSGGSIARFTRSDAWSAVTPMVSASFDVTDDVMIYGKISQGYKSGGFDSVSAAPSFDEETAWAYQAGVKSMWFDNLLSVNAEAFYYQHKDLQVTTLKTVGLVAQLQTANGGDATDWGFDLEFVAAPTDNFRIVGGVGYVNAEYGDFASLTPITNTPVNLNGNQLIRTPEWSSNLAVIFDIPTEIGTFTFRGEHQYKGDYFFTEHNEDLLSQEAYNLVNGRISFTTLDDTWTIAVWGKNLTDELTYMQKFDIRGGALGTIGLTPNSPRTYGLQIIANF